MDAPARARDAPRAPRLRCGVPGAAAGAGGSRGTGGAAAPGGAARRGGRELYRGERHSAHRRGRGGGRHQHQACQVRLVARGATHDRRGPGAPHARDGGMHDRVVARDHRRRALHAAARRGRSGRRRADRERPVPGGDDRRRTDRPADRAGAGCAPAMNRSPAAEVILPLPVARPYAYRLPDGLAARAVPGARVVVPVRRRRVIGVVAALLEPESSPRRDLKDILATPDAEPALTPELLRLVRWISNYYGAPLGLALRALLPGPLWQPARPAGPREVGERVLTLTRGLPSLLERERAFRRSPKRRAAYEAGEARGGSAPLRHLVTQLQLSPAVLDGLVSQGLARLDVVMQPRDPFAGLSSPPPPTLTADQRRVVDAIAGAPPEVPALIHGVTGSGKTLAYLEVMRRTVADGRGAILLVPEIGLTPQTVARVRGVFGDQVAVLHSGLSEGERADAWRALRRGDRRVAVGARSAIFAPVQRLGAIVVDEVHESSYKQGTAPRYHARDAAVTRARLEGARVLLGSATPSLETLHEVREGRTRLFELPERIGARPLPPVAVVDLRTAAR